MRRFWRIAVPAYLGPRYWLAAFACCGFLTAGASGLRAYEVNGVIAPLGVYAHVDLADAIDRYVHNQNEMNNTKLEVGPCSALPEGVNKTDLQDSLNGIYLDLLNNPAISGITLGIHWCAIQVCAPKSTSQECQPFTPANGYDWSYLDGALSAVTNYNINASYKKNVQLLITPGFDTPPWLLDPKKIQSCDALFLPGAVKAVAGCGKVTFTSFPEQKHTDGSELPLPWSSTYINAWVSFLQNLSQETQKYPSVLAAIAVAGPVGGSTEMILPTTALGSSFLKVASPPLNYNWLNQADDMWQTLIDNALKSGDIKKLSEVFPNYSVYSQYPDQLFVDSWIWTINQYQKIFPGVTLILTADSGIKELPELGRKPGAAFGASAPDATVSQVLTNQVLTHGYNVYEALKSVDCETGEQDIPISASCQAKAEILSYFATANTPGSSILLATDVGGMTAASNPATGDIGVPGVKVLTAWPFTPPPNGPPAPSPSILGGAEFDFPVTLKGTRKIEGCPSGKPNCRITPVKAAYNVFTYFFACTAAGANTSSASNFTFATACASPKIANAPIHFVDVDYVDVEYANNSGHDCPSLPIIVYTRSCPYPKGQQSYTSLQDLLNQASYALLTTAKQSAQSIGPTCQKTVQTNCQ